jgi:preprotein translocase subunit SecE
MIQIIEIILNVLAVAYTAYVFYWLIDFSLSLGGKK